MLTRFFTWLFTSAPAAQAPTPAPRKDASASVFTTDVDIDGEDLPQRAGRLERLQARVFGQDFAKTVRNTLVINDTVPGAQSAKFAMDEGSGASFNGIKAAYTLGQSGMPDLMAAWYASQGFIGYQMAAIIAQHWLVEKACMVPARDAVRKGYKVTSNDGSGKTTEVLAAIEKADKRYRLKRNLVEFVKMGRTFGIRVAMFKVRSVDPQYYTKPFNPDGVLPGTYDGIVQIDPYWCVPELTTGAAMDPTSIDFYEPTYWIVNAQRIHKSHLVIMRGADVADILKPSYLYGGISVPQRVYERVYAAERCANEAPQLMLSKRSTVFYTDTTKALANQAKFEERMSIWSQWMTNFGIKVADKDGDKIEQTDTTLTDLDVNIMTQYQLVAAAANIPATKLLGTSPKGFGAAGDYEIESYHEELEAIQVNDLEPLINRHHVCVIRSEIAPKFSIAPFEVEVTFNPLDTPTGKELAEINKAKADTDKALVDAGALDGHDVRARLAKEATSGYDGIALAVDPADDPEPDAGVQPLPGAAAPAATGAA